MNLRLAITGALSGFLSAMLVDLNAWAKTTGMPFDWQLAVKRWFAGAIVGLTSAAAVEP